MFRGETAREQATDRHSPKHAERSAHAASKKQLPCGPILRLWMQTSYQRVQVMELRRYMLIMQDRGSFELNRPASSLVCAISNVIVLEAEAKHSWSMCGAND